MILYLLRHGFAEAARPGQADADRSLTDAGVRQLHRQATVYARMHLGVEHLFSSPLLRARQTADVIGAHLGCPVEVVQELRPGATLEGVEDLVQAVGEPSSILLVGHQPYLGEFTTQLTGARVVLRPGALASITCYRLRPGGGQLAGLYDPDVVASLATDG